MSEEASAELSAEEVEAAPEAVEEVSEESYEESEVEASGEEVSEAEAEAVEEIQEAIADGASEEEVQALIEKFTIKVNGQEKEVEVDWNNKDDIKKAYQMAAAANEAMQARAESEKLLKQREAKFKEDPWAVMREHGFDEEEVATAKINELIAELEKSPEQKAQDAKDKELEDLRAQLKAEKDAKEAAELERLQKSAELDLEQEITAALSATTSLPKSAYTMKRVADGMAWAMDNGYPDIKAQDIIPIVEKELNSELNELFDSMPDDVLEKFMSKKVTDRLRKGRLAKMPAAKKKIVDTGKTDEAPVKRKKMSLLEFQKKGTGRFNKK